METDAETFAGDYLVVAPVAELVPWSIPGFEEAAHNLYTPIRARV